MLGKLRSVGGELISALALIRLFFTVFIERRRTMGRNLWDAFCRAFTLIELLVVIAIIESLPL